MEDGAGRSPQAKRCLEKDHCSYDNRERRFFSLRRGHQLQPDNRLGSQEAGLLVPDQLRKKPARARDHGSQYICEGAAFLLKSLLWKFPHAVDCFTVLLNMLAGLE